MSRESDDLLLCDGESRAVPGTFVSVDRGLGWARNAVVALVRGEARRKIERNASMSDSRASRTSIDSTHAVYTNRLAFVARSSVSALTGSTDSVRDRVAAAGRRRSRTSAAGAVRGCAPSPMKQRGEAAAATIAAMTIEMRNVPYLDKLVAVERPDTTGITESA